MQAAMRQRLYTTILSTKIRNLASDTMKYLPPTDPMPFQTDTIARIAFAEKARETIRHREHTYRNRQRVFGELAVASSRGLSAS
jgi:hypothetical protein